MSQYNFKKITVVPTAKDFKDIVLSKTQRKTPTVIHKHYAISRIRSFYMRKIKFAQQSIHDKLSEIIQEFPKLDEVHPFYSDLMNILYDKDHYKIALGQMSTARHLVDNVSREYVRLLKYGDSLYRCKQLKRAALGRFMKVVRKQKSSFEYLEQVRQHLARLPSIDPNTRTLILCGYPNVGKSSFINAMTRADVEVQPYAFTTKSLYVGHMDYKFLRWQIIDTPGILDQPLEARNTIEMQAVTALAHLRAAVVYVMDPSEMCGYSIQEQCQLFENIRPLFAQKPLIIALNKADVKKVDELPDDKRQLLQQLESQNVKMLEMSTVTKDGLTAIRDHACDQLLAQRVEGKLRSKDTDSLISRIHVAQPKPRDSKERPPCIPEAVLRKRQQAADRKTRKLEKYIMEEEGDDYILNLKKNYDLADDSEKYDKIPEIWNGHNIADFVDTNILEKLELLREEERLREAAGFYDDEPPEDSDDLRLLRHQAAQIRTKQLIATQDTRRKKMSTKPVMPRRGLKRSRQPSTLEDKLDDLGVSVEAKRMRHLQSKSRERNAHVKIKVGKGAPKHEIKSEPSRAEQGLAKEQKKKVKKVAAANQRPFRLQAKKGEGDHHIGDLKPKHLFAGKRKSGKTSRR